MQTRSAVVHVWRALGNVSRVAPRMVKFQMPTARLRRSITAAMGV